MVKTHLTKETPLVLPQVEIKASPIHGYGVFAAKDYAVGDLIEEAPALFFRSTTRFPVIVYDRVFYAGNGWSCLPLGYGGVYNHAENWNAKYQFDRSKNLFQVFARQPITQGSEICIDYGTDYFRARASGLLVKFRNNERLKTILKSAVVISLLLVIGYYLRS